MATALSASGILKYGLISFVAGMISPAIVLFIACFDVEADIVDQLREAFENEKKPGQSFSDWLNSKDQDYLIRLQLKEGGDADRSFKPSDTGEYKQTNLIDKINDIMLFRSTLSPKDNAIIDDLLERSLGRKK